MQLSHEMADNRDEMLNNRKEINSIRKDFCIPHMENRFLRLSQHQEAIPQDILRENISSEAFQALHQHGEFIFDQKILERTLGHPELKPL